MLNPNTLPPWLAQQTRQLLAQRGHAWLLQGPSGLGQYSLALALARAWLCENATPQGACGTCPSCHAMDVRTHADVCVLMPEVQMLALYWPLSEKAQSDIDEKKRKPSKEIRVEAMRDAVQFTQRTSARGRGKVVLVFPAEQMNHISANALLKTLEEPPGDVKFVLATESAHQLLPTIRSRCLGHTMAWPDAAHASQWLQAQGLDAQESAGLLQAAGGRPDDALAFKHSGRSPEDWATFPQAMARGHTAFVKEWSAPQIVDALQKLCHDLLASRYASTPRFFGLADLPPPPDLSVLTAWSKALLQTARTMEHPFNPGLMQEALVGQAQSVLHSPH